MNEKVNIILDGKHLTAHKGDYILNVAKDNGVDIPTLCNDPRLEPYSSCYVCVVEVEGMRGLQPACSTRVQEGMVVNTHNEKVRKSRKAALDLIMSNHYADCVAPCKSKCPAGVDVQGYISLIEKKMYKEAVALIKEVNPLPAICGRVCVRPCEAACNRNDMDENTPVGIDYMKRYASDMDLASEDHYKPEIAPSTGKKVAIIGGGPGGLSSAYFLQQKGHQCDIFEAAPYAGGWLRYGIPEYRLPNDILDQEIETITELGVNIYCNTKLGKDIHYKELQEKYDSVILTIGSQKGTLVGVEGDDAENVFPGITFLKNLEITGQKPDFTGKKVIVVGGGNTAMDCCRTSIRLGSTDVKVVYRRTEKEMPANPIEIHESKLEGVEYLFLNNPTKVNKDENGKLKSVTLIKMELGEPDASGRRRPVPVQGSEYEVEADYILAAIGQKTDVDFMENVNSVASEGKLEVNRWNDIDADSKTLQTGIPSMFAAGDGVTGAATIIEAVAQAKIASRSCHQYLMGEELVPEKAPFVSLRSNFNNKHNDNFREMYPSVIRQEMPVLDEGNRINFDEVELGYSEEMCQQEAARCMECGCGEFMDCDLQKFSDEYNVDQKKFAGEYNEYKVDFRHPYIEIDNNKCILCSRCIRICDEVVGANALGLVERGFKTYVAPALGESLKDTNCQSCGLCIDTCPTGAMRENVIFKPGPVKVEPIYAIDNYGSEGVAMNLLSHKKKFVMGVEGVKGLVNPLKSIGQRAKFGYKYLNDSSRITTPLLKENGVFKPISFEKAFEIIAQKINAVDSKQNLLLANARLTNEELYLVQKLAREGVKTPYVASLQYLGQGAKKYVQNSKANVPFGELKYAQKIYVIGADLVSENDYVGFLVNQARKENGAEVIYVTTELNAKMMRKSDQQYQIKDYHCFVKALNYYYIKNGLENQVFIVGRTQGFEDYKAELLTADFEELADKAGMSADGIESFAKDFNNEINAVAIFAEKYLGAETSMEMVNLAMLTGKLGKSSSGIISLKEKNNTHGVIDMGATPCLNVGGIASGFEPEKPIAQALQTGDFKNILVFGEDPIGTAKNTEAIKSWFKNHEFMVVQDYFMTATAELADLILPASFPMESAGSFTNTQRVIQQFTKQVDGPIERTNVQQLSDLGAHFGLEQFETAGEVFMEIITKLPQDAEEKFTFKSTGDEVKKTLFNFGADNLMLRFDRELKDDFLE